MAFFCCAQEAVSSMEASPDVAARLAEEALAFATFGTRNGPRLWTICSTFYKSTLRCNPSCLTKSFMSLQCLLPEATSLGCTLFSRTTFLQALLVYPLCVDQKRTWILYQLNEEMLFAHLPTIIQHQLP